MAQFQGEAHVLGDGLVRIERIILEHHRDVPVFGGEVVDDPLADPDVAGGDRFQPGDHPQQGRLSAAGRTDEDDELPIRDIGGDTVDDFDGPVGLAHVDDVHRCHSTTPRSVFPSRSRPAPGRRRRNWRLAEYRLRRVARSIAPFRARRRGIVSLRPVNPLGLRCDKRTIRGIDVGARGGGVPELQ